MSSLSGKILENGVMPCRSNVSHRKSTEANFLVRSNSVRNFTVTYLSCRTIIRLGLEGLAFLYQVWLGGFGVCLRYLACWGWVAWQKNKVFANLVRASLCRPPSLVLHDCLSSFHYCVGTGVQSMATGDFNSVLKKRQFKNIRKVLLAHWRSL